MVGTAVAGRGGVVGCGAGAGRWVWEVDDEDVFVERRP